MQKQNTFFYHKTIATIFAGLTLAITLLTLSSSRSNPTLTQPLNLSLSWLLMLAAGGVALTGRRAFALFPTLRTAALVAPLLAGVLAGLSMAMMHYSSLLLSLSHLLAGVATLGLATYLTVASFLPLRQPVLKIARPHPEYVTFQRSMLLAGVSFLLLLASGTLVSQTGWGQACPDWPLCWGQIFPAQLSLPVLIALLHRFSVVFVGVLIGGIILQTRRVYADNRLLNGWAAALGWLFLGQTALGGLYSITTIPPHWISAAHLSVTTIIWSSLVALASCHNLLIEPPPAPDAAPRNRMSAKTRLLTYFKLTKPWVMSLLLVTTVTAMIIAASGLPSLSLILTTLLGGALSAGGASVLNSYIDSDIDTQMSRTSRRATVTGLVTPQETLIFGLVLSTLSFLLYAIFVNMLSAVLSTIGIIYYVFFYTLYLKRNTIHNIIIGGAAGAIPPLVGWTAVTNSLDLGAFYLFAIIFFWTPPHTWALAMMVKKDYARVNVPMLPVVVGEKETAYQIFLYSLLLIPLTLLPFTFEMVSWFYLALAALLGARFLHLAWKLLQDYTDKSVSRKLYKYSQSYLALLFMLMALDRSLF